MKKTMKKIALFGVLSVALIGVLGTHTACSSCRRDKEVPVLSYEFNENLFAELGVVYDPKITVGEGTSVAGVEVYDVNGILLETGENYTFIPDAVGEYYYHVVFQFEGENTTMRKTITVRDTLAPTITTEKLAPFTVELGVYTVTVSDSGEAVQINGVFTTGKVGTEYTVPSATLGGQALQVEVKQNGNMIALQGGKFTPTVGGRYVVQYKLESTVVDTYEFAVEEKNAIDFENASVFNFEKTYGEVKKNQDVAYVDSGVTSAKIKVYAGGKAGFVWNTPVVLTENANFVTANAYANVAGTVKLQLLIGETLTAYESGVITLSRGANEIVFPLSENLKDKAVYGILLYNYNQYDNIVFLDNVRFVDEWSLTDVFTAHESIYKAERGGTFILPQLTNCDRNFFKTVMVEINGNGLTEPIMLTENAKFHLTAFAEGDYTVTYTAIDIFDETHETSFTLRVQGTALMGTLSLGTYYVGEEITLPQVKLTSETYTNVTLQNATVKKYYRPENGLTWEKVPQPLIFELTGTHEFRYVITVGTSKLMLEADTYIHNPNVHIDFEKYAGGEHMHYSGDTSYSKPLELAPSDYWSHGGKYSCKMYARVGWEWENGVRMGNQNRLLFDYPIDTVVFYGYSDYDLEPTYMITYIPALLPTTYSKPYKND
jgi:hypothetical protein